MTQLDGCIETMLVKDFNIRFWHCHSRRLRKSIAAISNKKINLIALEQKVDEYMNQVALKDYVLKIQYNICHQHFQFSHREFEAFANPPRVAIFKSIRLPIHDLSWIKHDNRNLYDMARNALKDLDLDDVILLNEHGNVCEATIANLFIKHDKTFITPSLDQGCVDGIYRKKVIMEMRKKGQRVEQRVIKPEELLQAKKVYFSNAVRGLYPVQLVSK